MTRYECKAGGASKFWTVKVSGKTLTTYWGRLGTDGQSKAKGFAKPSDAVAEMAKLIREKTSKGYRPAKAGATKPVAKLAKPASKPAAKSKANGTPAKPVARAKSKPSKSSKQEKPTMTLSASAVSLPAISAPRPRDGAYVDLDPRTDKERTSGQFTNGAPHGEWCWFDDGGTLRRRANFRAGVLDGACERSHVNRKPSERGSFRDGKRDGLWVSYFPAGSKQAETTYEHGLRHGPDREYYPSGKLKEERTYVRDKAQDARRTYFETGEVKSVRTGENEPEMIYFPGGGISREEPRRDGRLHGKLLSYDEQGRPDWQCDYVDGVKHGVETFWKDGKVETTQWLCGVPASKLGSRELKALAARFNKKGDRYEKLEVLSEVTEGDGDNNRLLWHLVREGLVDVTKTPDLWNDLAADDAFTSADVVGFLSSLKNFDHEDSWTERFLPCWPAALDEMTCKAYARDPRTIDAALGKLPKLVRDGVRTVRARFGLDEREHFDGDITTELATQNVERGIGGSNQEVRWFRDGRLQEVCLAEGEGSARPGAAFYELIALFTTREAFLDACVKACGKYDRELEAQRLADVLRIAPPADFSKLIIANDRILNDHLPFILELREDPPGTLLTWAKTCDRPAKAEILAALAVVRLAAAKLPIPEGVEAFFTDGGGLSDSEAPWSALRRGFGAVGDEEWQDIDPKHTTDRLLATLRFGDAVARMPGAFGLYQRALAALPVPRASAILHRLFAPENIRAEHAIALAGPYLSPALWSRIQAQIEAREPEYYGDGQAYALGLAALPAMALPWIFEAFSKASKKLKPFYERAMLYALAAAAERGELWPEAYDQVLHFGPFHKHADGKFDSDYAHALRGALRGLPTERARPIFDRAYAQKPQIALRTFVAIGSHPEPAILRPAFELLLAERLKLEDDDQDRIRWALAALGDDGPRLALWVLAQRAKQHAGLDGAFFPCLGQAFWDARNADADEDEPRDQSSGDVDRVQELAELLDALPDNVPMMIPMYALTKGERPAGRYNQIGGAPAGITAATWPMAPDGDPMQLLFMLDLLDLPELGQVLDRPDCRAIAMFVSGADHHSAWEPGNDHVQLVYLGEDELAAEASRPDGAKLLDEEAYTVHRLEVPAAIFHLDDDGDDEGDEGELRAQLVAIKDKVYLLHARVLGSPLWLQRAGYGGDFVMQFDEAFVDMNIGDAGIMYVFADTAFQQCH